MNSTQKSEVTRILHEWKAGDSGAPERLMPYVYDELKRQARFCMSRERSDHTLQPTALVHEAFLKLADVSGIDWQDRGHFFAIAARLMRQILVDHARQHSAAKRGSGRVRLSIDDVDVPVEERAETILIVNDALDRLAAFDSKQSQIVEMRFFGGLTNSEISQSLEISERTVAREWRSAQLWLLRELSRV